MKEKEAKQTADQGSLRRLWAEFTDPGPAGDTPVFLKKYLDGVVPGCMGLLFMAVGILVGALGGLANIRAEKSWVPILFGGVFALAGFGVLSLGVKTILNKSAGRKK